MSSCQVLYLDYQSHPVPLALCYYVAGRNPYVACGVSHRIPPCTTNTELESGYCPQCLGFWDASVVMNSTKGKCIPSHPHSMSTSHRSSTQTLNKEEEEEDEDRTTEDMYQTVGGGCKACPICNCTLVMTMLPDYSQASKPMICVWSCGYCHWDSTEAHVSVPLLTEDQGGVEATVHSLQRLLGVRMVEDHKPKHDIVQTLQTGYRKQYAEEIKNKRQRDLLAMHGLVLNHKDDTLGEDQTLRGRKSIPDLLLLASTKTNRPTWTLEALEKTLEKKKQTWNHSGDGIQAVSPLDKLWKFQTLSPSFTTSSIRTQLTSTIPTSSLLPKPISLLPRTIRRCRAELDAGRPGILVKPKSNPMDGDTSLKYGHGQWWKKDSSAIHMIPKVKIIQYGTDDSSHGRYYAFLLLVTNPRLETIHVTLDRPVMHPHDSKDDDDHEIMKNVILDSYSLQSVNARYEYSLESIHDDNNSGVSITLEPMEDLFLDLGMNSPLTSNGIFKWDAKTAISRDTNKTVGFHILCQKKDRVWIEFILDRGHYATKPSDMTYFTTPIRLKIDTNDGILAQEPFMVLTLLLLAKYILPP